MRPATNLLQNNPLRLIIVLLLLTSVLILSCDMSDLYAPYGATDIPDDTLVPTETLIPTKTPDPTKAAYVSGFAGSWDTNWGIMTCSVNGQTVDCNYTHDTGKISASLGPDGMTMQGTWSEAPSYQPTQDAGKVTFSLSGDGSSIAGHWWYGQDGEGGPWTGTRK